jgi:hypothetical protein
MRHFCKKWQILESHRQSRTTVNWTAQNIMAAALASIWTRREALQYTSCFRTTRVFTNIYSSEANMGVVTSQDQHRVSRISLQNVYTQLNNITCSAV